MFRKISGWLIIVALAMPALFGITWVVGLSRVVASPLLWIQIPKKVITKLPEIVDSIVEAGQKPGAIDDPNSQLWFEAMVKAGNPGVLLSDIGIYKWLETDLLNFSNDLSDVWKEEIKPSQVDLNMIGLKSSLRDPRLTGYILDTMAFLPACTKMQMDDWTTMFEEKQHMGDVDESYEEDDQQLPACNPGSQMVNQILLGLNESVSEIPDSFAVPIESGDIPALSDIANLMYGISFLLFIIPLGLLLIGVFIANRANVKRLRIFGFITLGVGVLVLISVAIANTGFTTAMVSSPLWWGYVDQNAWSDSFRQQFGMEMVELIRPISEELFGSVNKTALAVSMLGAIVTFGSFMFPKNSEVAVSTQVSPALTSTPTSLESPKPEKDTAAKKNSSTSFEKKVVSEPIKKKKAKATKKKKAKNTKKK